jgi:hypothetical protein
MYRIKFQNQDRRKKKYNNKSQVYTTTLYGTRTFHSIKEANYCEELDWLLKAKAIKHYELQHKIDIRVNNIHICNYFIDFRVTNADDSITMVEVKGFATPEWQLKWKLTQALKEEIEPGAAWEIVK